MIDYLKLKIEVLKILNERISERITNGHKAIQVAELARDSESKSSAGDKYETGRAMMQREIANNKAQVSTALHTQNILKQISPERSYGKVELGALVQTSVGIYLISIGEGKLSVQDNSVYAVSVNSPIGRAMIGLRRGEDFFFNTRNIKILSIY